jgi:hypothetical protein
MRRAKTPNRLPEDSCVLAALNPSLRRLEPGLTAAQCATLVKLRAMGRMIPAGAPKRMKLTGDKAPVRDIRTEGAQPPPARVRKFFQFWNNCFSTRKSNSSVNFCADIFHFWKIVISELSVLISSLNVALRDFIFQFWKTFCTVGSKQITKHGFKSNT